MKYLFVTLLHIMLIDFSWAQSLTIQGPCSAQPLHRYEVSEWNEQHVGAFTLQALHALNLNYEGNERGINSIDGSATGMDALEILSESEMRAYGWCYRVNGLAPEQFPDEIMLTAITDQVEWFFAFAHYKEGVWISQCEPAYLLKPNRFCAEIPSL